MEKTQRNNIMLAFFTLLAVIVIVSIIGFFTLGKGPEIIHGREAAQASSSNGPLRTRKPRDGKGWC